jgi:hypothetical protein
LGAIERRCDPPLPHRQHGVAQARELAQIARIDQRAAAAGDEIADQGVDLRLGGNVDALRRLLEQQHADPACEPFRQDHLLLITAGESACRELRPPRADVEQLEELGDDAVAGAAVEPEPARERREVGQQDVVADRLVHHQPEPPLARHHADAGGDGVDRALQPSRGVTDLHLRGSGHSEQAPQHPVGAAAEKPGEADRLARTHPDAMIAVRLGGEQHLAGRDRRGDDLVGRPSGHRGHQIVHREGAAPAHRRDPPVAQHRAAVGDRHHLVEAMRDIDDGGALPFHAGEDGKQSLDLALFQRRRRLVEDEDAAFSPQRLGDRHQLARGEAQRRDRPVGIGIEVELGEHRACLLSHARAVDHRERAEAAHRQVAERDVLGDRQRRHQPQLLRNGHDAGGDGIVRAREMAKPAVDEDIAAVWTMHAAEDADQGRLAGAVLADDGVDLAKGHVEVDAVERDRRAELLADRFGACGRMAHRINAARRQPASSRR